MTADLLLDEFVSSRRPLDQAVASSDDLQNGVDRLLEAYRYDINEPQILLSGDDPTSLFKVTSDAIEALA
jgi:hypothetical protein